jgi:hypothetical protein
MARSLREHYGDDMPLLSSVWAESAPGQPPGQPTPVRYFSLGPSPADGGSPGAAAVRAVFLVIEVASPSELRATGVGGAGELGGPPEYVYEWGVSSFYSEQAAGGWCPWSLRMAWSAPEGGDYSKAHGLSVFATKQNMTNIFLSS